MPESIHIAAFVLGGVLLLISILGGRFKIFGAEVSGQAGARGRIGAGVAACLLLAFGLTTAGKKDEHQTERVAASSEDKPTPTTTYANDLDACKNTGASFAACDCYVAAVRGRFGSAADLAKKVNDGTANADELGYLAKEKKRCALEGALSTP